MVRFFTGRDLLVAALTTGILASCASFPYKYFGMDSVSYTAGKLLGPKPEDDLPFTACEPTQGDPHPCVVMFTSEFFAFKQDYIDTQNRLSACERGQPVAGKEAAPPVEQPPTSH